MSGYLIPVADEPDLYVSASWQDHKDRTPPSGEPGTDYACSTGTPVRAVDDGKVVEIKKDNSGAMGRYVAVRLADGRDTRTLHMQTIDVAVGRVVKRGDRLGTSGASGYGSDYYYGPHAHQTLWPGRMWQASTIDFEPHVGADPAPTPPDQEDDDMARNSGIQWKDDGLQYSAVINAESGFYNQWQSGDADYNKGVFQAFDVPYYRTVTPGHAAGIKASCQAVNA